MTLRSAIRTILNRLRSWFRRDVHPIAPVDSRWSRRDVLIGSFRSRAQFTICLRRRFYYIPACLVPDGMLPIRWVAMFQTPRIFSRDAGIRWYGEVIRTDMVPRSEIREVPMRPESDPQMPYYRYRIRKWKQLPQPIRPGEFAFVNEFTTRFLLEHAEFVTELLLHSEEEYRLCRELKRRTRGQTVSDTEINGIRIRTRGDTIQLCRGDVILEQCTIAEFTEHPTAVLNRMYLACGDSIR